MSTAGKRLEGRIAIVTASTEGFVCRTCKLICFGYGFERNYKSMEEILLGRLVIAIL